MFSTITARLLADAGIGPGQTILDIGCGLGDVTRAVAGIVGPHGRVVGLDCNEATLASARAASVGAANIEYVRAELTALPFAGPSFDGIVGRRVLMYLAEPQAVLGALAGLLRPGAALALQEHDTTMTPGRSGRWPLHDRVHEWIWRTVAREGADGRLGFTLPQRLSALGLDVESLRLEAIAAGHEHGRHHALPTIVEAILPRIVAQGVATAEDVDVPTLGLRLEAERAAQASLYVTDLAVCVVARAPSGIMG